ncbi:MAG: DUF1573 domain-containing protein [Candidatus Levybacteria bacterium]|nr:DUF1573 domain-containing protein [Candidatus Levybacteria bacterium]
MNDKKLLAIIIVVTLIILAGGVMVLGSNSSSSPQVRASKDAKAYTLEPTSFDWGNIQYAAEKATKTFTIKNTGKDTLKLFNIKTSCHCTIAKVTVDGKTSPDFGMSGISSWIGEVSPGKEAKLTVIFDQAFHGPQGVGPVTRFVSVETSDKDNGKITYTLTGTVVR